MPLTEIPSESIAEELAISENYQAITAFSDLGSIYVEEIQLFLIFSLHINIKL